MRRLISFLISATFMAALAFGAAWAYLSMSFREAGPALRETSLIIEPGSGLSTIAEALEDKGVVSDAELYRMAVRFKGDPSRLQAGEFRFPPGASMEEITTILTEGKAVQHKLTFTEGMSRAEILRLIEAAPLLSGEVIRIPAEGMLAPETYFFQRGEDRQAIIDRLEASQKDSLDRLWASRAPGLPLSSPGEALTLASIVEKETGLAAERPLVASVFINRLNKGMRLQSDPTVIYGITEGAYDLGRGLRRSELDKATPYNTYVIKGLPPTPIANPGHDSIRAALNPAQTAYLYFVADGTGGHVFAKTLKEHNRNVTRWRKIEKERARQ